MAEAANAGPAGDLRARAEHDIGLDGRAAAHLGVEREMHRLGCGHGHAGGEEGLALNLLEQGLGHGQLALGVDAHDGVLIGEHRPGRGTAPAGQLDHVGQIEFALGIVVPDLGQQFEQQADRRGHDAGVAGGQGQNLGRGFLGLGYGRERVAVHDQPAIVAGIAGLEADDGDALVGREDRLDIGGAQQGHVAIGDDHLTHEIAEHGLCGAHGVAGAQGRVLNGDGVLPQPFDDMVAHLRGVRPDHHHDPLAAQRLGGVDGVVQHGPAADRMQHLGQSRLHARALAGREDDGGPPVGRLGVGMAGHESVRRLVTPVV